MIQRQHRARIELMAMDALTYDCEQQQASAGSVSVVRRSPGGADKNSCHGNSFLSRRGAKFVVIDAIFCCPP